MKTILDYIYENSDSKVKVTLEWMKQKYAEFNEKLFENKLPYCILEAKKLPKHSLGRFTFGELIFCLTPKNFGGYKKYRIYKSVNNQPKSISDISEVEPAIYMNTDVYFTDETSMESTLIHEMIHFYTYKDCWSPAIAHGKEFRYWCRIIKVRGKRIYNKEFDLTIYADQNKYELADDIKEKEEKSLVKHGLDVVIVEVLKDKYPERVMFTTKSHTQLIINEARKEHAKHKNLKRILVLRNVLDLMPHSYFQNFSKTRQYRRFYIPENVKEMWDKIMSSPDLEIVYDKENGITEGKIKELLRKVKEKIVNLLVKPQTDLSIEDIEKIGKIIPIEIEEC